MQRHSAAGSRTAPSLMQCKRSPLQQAPTCNPRWGCARLCNPQLPLVEGFLCARRGRLVLGSDMVAAAGNAWDELQADASAIAAQQRTAELTEWLGCAKITLQVRVSQRQA